MSQNDTQFFEDIEKCIDAILARVGPEIVLGMPLGLGKPCRLINALYRRAREDSGIHLKIITAISLEKPRGRSSLEKKFLEPFVERQFNGVPDLDYAEDVRNNTLPKNIELCEFFFKAGSYLNHPSQQQNFVYSNYTHAARDLLRNGVNVVAQMIAKKQISGKTMYSFSCNPDLSIDLESVLHELERQGTPVAFVGEVNSRLPFMHNHAMFSSERLDMIVDKDGKHYELFGVPNAAITPADHMIGFNASALIKDGGTLQVGIGSLGSALVYSTILRHADNEVYQQIYDELQLADKFPVVADIGGTGTFSRGLYGCSEMMVDGFMYLYRAGILTREVFDDPHLQKLINAGKISNEVSFAMLDQLVTAGVVNEKLRARDVAYLKRYGIFKEAVDYKGGALIVAGEPVTAHLGNTETRSVLASKGMGQKLAGGIVMHGGFFLGPSSFYEMLRNLSDEEHQKFCMTSVNFINDLFDHMFGRQDLKVAQRKEARFINSTMMATLGGAAVSDGLANGKVVSGVGGQYNFVAMAHEIADARSILKLKSTRQSGGKTVSNIMNSYGHITIPRHLRDIYITEYGVADLLGLPDRDVYIEMLKITDSRFQEQLLAEAKYNGKVPSDFRLPEKYRHNTPERIQEIVKKYQHKGHFSAFPFGCDFTAEELTLGKALKSLKTKTSTRPGLLKSVIKALANRQIPADVRPLLERMQMENPQSFRARLEQKLLISELIEQMS